MNEASIKAMIAIYSKDILGTNPSPRQEEMLLTLCENIERTTRDAAATLVNDCSNKVRNLAK